MRLIRPAFERLLGLSQLSDIYSRVTSTPAEDDFIERVLGELDVRIDLADTELSRIPGSGPLIVVANHPFGGLDGLVLAALLRRVRPDVKLMANHLLARVPEMARTCLFVDPFGGPDAARRNLASIRAAMHWVKDGGALGVFPAGEVSHRGWRRWGVVDPAWSASIGRLARQAGAAVLPVFFRGQNSMMFQVAGMIHPKLRTALLPRELLKKRHGKVRVEIGSVIGPAKLAGFEDADHLTSYLRARTHLLGARGRASVSSKRAPRRAVGAPRAEPVVAAVPADELEAEVASLPAEQTLAQSGRLRVLLTRAAQAPQSIREIGRLREITFRQVGEGTGRPLDLDRFDEHYLHLFVWNSERREIVGAYRLGLMDEILATRGRDGLYTSTLFRFRPGLLEQLGHAIELGRSFVRFEYQKEFAPLMMLWKGIGGFVARHPQYNRLLGPVSISNEYESMTRWLLMAFLRLNRHLPALANLVAPRNSPVVRPPRDIESLLSGAVANDIDQVDELVADIESDRRSMPVLLRQYLKLNAKVLGFNVDPQFSDVLDALMLVDLTQVDRVVLTRYLTREGAQRFWSHHRMAASGVGRPPT
jgi:putative hemolysin